MKGTQEGSATVCVVGIDFGTDSVRSIVADATTGAVLGTSVKYYPRWAKGLYCDPVGNRFRQHPLDYLESMESSVREALGEAGARVAARVRGIAVDTTGSTPALADRSGKPLALSAPFADNPNAMFVLWKDHTAVAEAERLNQLARTWGGVDYTKYVGGIYSSEWFWAKAIHVLETDAAVAEAAVTVVEHCDWIPAVLTGTTDLARFKRSRCAAGHKALWHAEFGGYPSDAFLAKLNPKLPALKKTLGSETFTSDTPFGTLSAEWAAKLGPAARDGRRGRRVRRAHGRGGRRHRPQPAAQGDGDQHLRHRRCAARERAREAGLRDLRAGGRVGDPRNDRLRGRPVRVRGRVRLVQGAAGLAAGDHLADAARDLRTR